MKTIPDWWTIVAVGSWNLAIFSLDWLGKNLFKKEDVTIEFALAPKFPARLSANKVRITPSADSILFAPTDLSDKHLISTEQVACNLLTLLPHTPITAIGINFGFVETEAEPDLIERFTDNDGDLFADAGFTINNSTRIKQLEFENQIINFYSILEPPKISFRINFHTNVTTTQKAKGAIENRVLKNREIALELLNKIYGLHLEDNK